MLGRLEKMARDSIDAWNAHDINRILSFYTDDVVYEDVPFARVNRGKAELKDFVLEMFAAFPDFKIDLKSVVVTGERAVTEWVMRGTFKGAIAGMQPTGKTFSVRGTSVGEHLDGKLKRNSDYYDGATFMQQIGLAPSAT